MFLKLTYWEEPEEGAPAPEPRFIWVNASSISHMRADTYGGPGAMIYTFNANIRLNVVETPEEILARIEAVKDGKVDA